MLVQYSGHKHLLVTTLWYYTNLSIIIIIINIIIINSVRHMHALWCNERTHCQHFDTICKGNHSSFLTRTVVVRWHPLSHKICARTDPPPSKNADFRQISAYNASGVRASKRSSIIANTKLTTGFPTSYEWIAYITPKSPKSWLKKHILRLL